MYSELNRILKDRVLVLDGAMGTMIQRLGLGEEDFRGERFADHPARLSGCNDLLCLTAPESIKTTHRGYLDAGADIITTNTFNSNAVSLEDYALGGDPGLIMELNRAAASLALSAAEEAAPRSWGGRALVAGSVGPTNRTASMSPDVSDPAARNVDYATLFAAYSDQIAGLIDGGVDLILFETVFDTLNLKAGLDAANKVMAAKGRSLPIMISATVSDKAGRTLSGQTIKAFIATVEDYDNVFSLGLNCGFGPEDVIPYIRELSRNTSRHVSCHPNAGLPNALGEYDETPEKFASHVKRILDERLVNIIGGCCGTTPAHISLLRRLTDAACPRIPAPAENVLRVTGLDLLEIRPENNFVNVGERCNVAGSRKFLRLIKEKKYDEAMAIAAAQVADGAMMIDVNMDDAMLDAREEMVRFLRCLSSDPDVAKVPVMVDSSDWDVIEAALENLQGKSIVNSISLKEGEESFIAKARRIRELGAAVIVMAFDEKGQADTFARKIEICRRAYALLTDRCGFKPDDIIFDVNVMAVATGMDEHRFYGIDFIKAVAWIKKNLPGARTSGGVSNLSFAFRGKNSIREAMHAVFLYHAISAGLDMGIVNPASTVTYDDIPSDLRSIIEDVILARREEAPDELAEYAAKELLPKEPIAATNTRDKSQPVGKRLSEAIIKGKGDFLTEDLDEALKEIGAPVDIIEGPLMEGMNRVGTLFGEGKMFLPQVVKTARTMKQAVDYLRPFMEKDRSVGARAGKVVFATVKGDVHDIGKNIVSIVLACNNYEVIDLGVMVPAETIVETVLKERPDMVCLSGLITPSLSEMVNVAKSLEASGIDIPILVGGATTSKIHTALKIAPVYSGAVVHASDAAQEPAIASQLINPATRDRFISALSEEYDRIRSDYERKSKGLLPIGDARGRKLKTGLEAYKPVIPAAGLGKAKVIDLDLKKILPFINWKMFFHAWRISGDYLDGFPYDGCDDCVNSWLAGIRPENREKALEAMRLYRDARLMLTELTKDCIFDGKAVVAFFKAYSNGDDIVVGGKTIPLLRQQHSSGECKCLSDFVCPEGGCDDYAGVFAVTAGAAMSKEVLRHKENGDEYGSLLLQTLSDRIAEAASEWLHCEVRRKIWAYAPNENLTVEEMLKGCYAGIRPAMGYPMLPDQLLNHTLGELIPFDKIGVSLTENGAMSPSSTVSGLYISSPASSYFMVGEIGDDQLSDYSSRRGMDESRVREILRL